MTTSDLMVIQYVYDMDRALAFYRDVLHLSPVEESSGWSMLGCGDALVGLHIISQDMDEKPVPFAGLNLRVDDLDAAVNEVKAAGGRVKDVKEDRPHVPVRLPVLEDTEGNVFELRQSVA